MGAMSRTVPGAARPARPHTGVTEDGRRLREVVTYARRSSRMSPGQAAAWERRSDLWWIPDEAVEQPGFDLSDAVAGDGPLLVEIGSGVGEATVALAAARPDARVLAFEVWRPGIAQTFLALEAAGVENVRLCSVDAVWCFAHALRAGSVEQVWTFFPDPWPKQRHHKRRLVGAAFATSVAAALAPGGVWRLATDWPDYAEQMREVLDAEPLPGRGTHAPLGGAPVDALRAPRPRARPPGHRPRLPPGRGRPRHVSAEAQAASPKRSPSSQSRLSTRARSRSSSAESGSTRRRWEWPRASQASASTPS